MLVKAGEDKYPVYALDVYQLRYKSFVPNTTEKKSNICNRLPLESSAEISSKSSSSSVPGSACLFTKFSWGEVFSPSAFRFDTRKEKLARNSKMP